METPKYNIEGDRKVWFSMWFLGAIVTFGLAFFPMFHRLINGRNNHFKREEALEKQITAFLAKQGKTPPAMSQRPHEMNAKAWTAAIILVIPVFVITYFLSKDLIKHEMAQDRFLAEAFPERMFMPQTIPIKTYALITLLTLGFGVIYWLYKVVNLYNAHFKAHLQLEKQITSLMEEKKIGEQNM
jgi:flagellar biogenesis protein FliO